MSPRRLGISGLLLVVTTLIIGPLGHGVRASHFLQCPRHLRAIFEREVEPTCTLLVDDATWSEVPSSPWTQRPYCIPSKKNPDDKFCTFTAPLNGRPITLITRPPTAATFSSAVTQPEPIWGHRKHLNGSFALPPSQAPYAVEDIEGKGKGLVATRKIARGELLMVDFPVLLAHLNFPFSMSEKDAETMLRSAFGGIDAETQEEVRGLARSTYGGIWEDVVRTNGFVVKPGGFSHIGLFVDISRMNHNCEPNAFVRFSPQTFSMEVFAWKDIPSGQEIEISYTAIGLTSAQRYRSLSTRGFQCTCSLCSSPDKLAASDTGRERLSRIKSALKNEKLGPSAAVDLMNEAMVIIEEEDLDLLLGEYYELFSHVYTETGNYGLAKEYAALAGEWATLLRGKDDAFEKRIETYVRELEKLEERKRVEMVEREPGAESTRTRTGAWSEDETVAGQDGPRQT